MSQIAYSFTVRPLDEEDGGGWIVEYNDLRGCIGTGDSVEQALHDAMEAKEAWLESALENNIPIPEPNTLQKHSGNYALRMPKSLHQWVAESAAKEGVSANQFVNHILSMAKGRRTP